MHAYAQSFSTVFLVAAPIATVAFLLTWLLPEVRLRTTAQETDVGHTFAMPTARSSQEEIERALHVLASRDSRSLTYRRLADRAGVALDPPPIAAPLLDKKAVVLILSMRRTRNNGDF
jgi:hypothetical protein